VSGSRLLSAPLRTDRQPDGRRRLVRPFAIALGYRDELLAPFDAAVRARSLRLIPPELREILELEPPTALLIPAGFDTDFSSIPVLARSVMGRWDRHDIAGVAHDWLYRVGAPRASADRAWRAIARSGHRRLGPVRGFLGWSGLRVGGWAAYRARARDRERFPR